MHTEPITSQTLSQSVIAVPPLARRADLKIDAAENAKLIRYLENGGVSTLLYGGNAVLYHIALSEYAQLLEMLVDQAAADTLVVPSVGPTFGMMMDQAEILSQMGFPTVMILPQHDAATSAGIVRGVRQFAERLGKPIVLYIKRDGYMPVDAVRAMVDEGLVSWIKYAVVRQRTADDEYLRELIDRVDPSLMVSGIGEQPAVIHMRDFGLAGFTSGCVCVRPQLSMEMLKAIQAGDFARAEQIQNEFFPLEELRNRIHPISVLHRAVSLGGIAETGPLLPLLSDVSAEERPAVQRAVDELLVRHPD